VEGPAAALDAFTDTVVSVLSYSLASVAYVENLTLSGTATQGTGNGLNNVITGNNLANTLSGLGGADTVVGSGGKDTLTGGSGADLLRGNGGGDRLTGEGGADDFEFGAALNASSNVDRVMDFVTGVDEIRLDRTVFTHIALGELAQGQYYEGTAAHDAGDRIIYNSGTGNLYYDADGSGAGAAIVFATLSGSPNLTAADFFIVA
jgi:Ca2+-binding RTX toxin-like protein